MSAFCGSLSLWRPWLLSGDVRRSEKHIVKSESGTYALILHSNLSTEIQIGHWGCLRVEPGYYVYVGSAFGPGGVQARVARHFRKMKRRHWHIDYLSEAIEPVCAWCSYAPFRLEHEWARAFDRMADMSCIKGFGCSDCNCNGHLLATPAMPDATEIVRATGGAVESWPNRMTIR